MNKSFFCVLFSAIVIIFLSACSQDTPKINCGVYRSENSDAYIEVFEDNTVQIMNYDLSGLETIIENDTIELANLNETDSQALKDSWDLNRDFANKRVKFETDDTFYKQIGCIDLKFPLNNPYGEGVVSWSISYYPAEKKLLLEAESITTDERVSEVFVLEK